MAARLGNVIYWACCGLAGIAALLFAIIAVEGRGNEATFWMVVYAVSGVTFWLFGRAVRYVLAGT